MNETTTPEVLQKEFPDSSNVFFCEYRHTIEELEVTYRKGDVYIYKGVPPQVWRELLLAPSIGKYIAQHIARTYEHQKKK